MSSDSREERERLKEEYKEHYRKMREVKERLGRARKTQNIQQALRNMDTGQMMETFDEFLFKVKSKLATVEARLDVAMESLEEDEKSEIREQERDESMQKIRAKETLRQVKAEMGLLYSEVEEQASALEVQKTIGTPDAESSEEAAPSVSPESENEPDRE